MRILSKEQILLIPSMLVDKTIKEIATNFDVHERTINRWVKIMRKQGIDIKVRRGRKPLQLN